MKRALLLLSLLAACAPREEGRPAPDFLPALFGGEPEPEVPAPLPPQVVAALPPGVPQSVVTRNADGCYLITIEQTDPPTGYPLQDAAGNQVCDGGAAPVGPISLADAPAPAPLAPDGLGPIEPGNITPPAPIVQPVEG